MECTTLEVLREYRMVVLDSGDWWGGSEDEEKATLERIAHLPLRDRDEGG